VNVACLEALSGWATCYIVCICVLNEVSCILEARVVL